MVEKKLVKESEPVEEEPTKWVLNIKKGTTINHPLLGKLEGGCAYQVTEHEANMIKNVINIVIFDEIIPRVQDD